MAAAAISVALAQRAIAPRCFAWEDSPMNRLSEIGLDTRGIEHYRGIVTRFEEIARASLEGSVRVSDLCQAIGVTSRTLERAVNAVHATTPLEFLRALRLAQARQTLSTCGSATTVTEVATRFGFRELGRFAGEYRDRFGESPSETLRRSARRCGAETAR